MATGAVALFGLTVLFARPKFDELKDIGRRQDAAMRDIEQDMQLVERRAQWEKELADLSRRLPVHPADKQMDTYWLAVMDDVAVKHGVKITKRQAGAEKKNGHLYELPIDCKEWEADLSSIIHFLFDLQEEGDMIDVQQLYIRPREGGLLRGRFNLNCAYTREPVVGKARVSEKTQPGKGQQEKGQP